MRKRRIRTISIFFAFFIFDLIRPFGYFFLPSLTFLALVSLALSNRLSFSFFLALFGGVLYDSLVFSEGFFYTLFYPLAVLVIFFLYNSFLFVKTKNYPLVTKAILSFLLVLFYVICANLAITTASFVFNFYFFIQSYLLFFLVDYLIGKSMPKNYFRASNIIPL